MADADLLVHVHIPKCAGTSIWHWMARYMPSAHGFLYPDAPWWFYYDEAMLTSELGIGNTALRCMSSHYFRVFPLECAGRRMRYFTLLRDPLRQFLSFVSYVRNVYRELKNEDALASVPPDADRLTLREITAWLLDVALHENYQSNFLASCEWRVATGRGPKPGTPTRRWEPADWEAYRAARPALAREILARFAVVGTVERFDETLRLLARRAPAWDVPLGPLDDLQTMNVTTGTQDTDWIHDGDPVGHKLLASLAEDRALHAYAGELLDAAL